MADDRSRNRKLEEYMRRREPHQAEEGNMRMDWVRHGEVPGNREKRYVGRTEESLTPEGRRAARLLRPEQPEIVFASPRLRCLETAALLYPGLTPVFIEELAECDFGDFEYKNYRELAGNPDYQEWIDSSGTLGFPGGESLEEFQGRCLAGFARCVEIMKEKGACYAAFVVHGGTIMAVLDRLSRPHRDYYSWQCRNLEIVRTEYENSFLTLVREAE